jgi:integrase
MALLPNEQMLLIESATGSACLPMFLALSAATGARRGEVLALRWSDIDGSDVLIARSLTQTRQGLEFKGTKTDRPRQVGLEESPLRRRSAH